MTNLTLCWLIPKDRSNRVRWLLRELNVEFSEKQLNASVGERAGPTPLNNQARSDKWIPVGVVKRPWAEAAG